MKIIDPEPTNDLLFIANEEEDTQIDDQALMLYEEEPSVYRLQK